MIKLLVIGDGVQPTGFSRVLHSITGNLPKGDYDISWLATNYKGDPHAYPYRIYPSDTRGDFYGMGRLQEIINIEKPNIVFILNDPWVTVSYLRNIEKLFPERDFKIVTYCPVDSRYLDPEWFKPFEIVSRRVLYNTFGLEEVKKVSDLDYEIIGHGVDGNIFHKDYTSRKEAKKDLFPEDEIIWDSFIVLSANRNQPRKKLDILMEGFSLFAKDKPENVKLYMHCGMRDADLDINKIADRYGISDRLLVSNDTKTIQTVSDVFLNAIYNLCDVGINTSLGEGFGLTNAEHAATGAPQIVPNHSALTELYKDCGILLPVDRDYTNSDFNTVGGMVHPKDVANALNTLYYDESLRLILSEASESKFTSEEFTWKYIADQWDKLFKEV